MGSGKSTVGPALAERLGARFVDLDEQVSRHAGRPVSRLWAERGECAFRALEAETLEALLDEPDEGTLVLALGGGTVVSTRLRRRLLREGRVLTLHAPTTVLAERLGAEARRARPLLAEGDPRDTLQALWVERRDAYAECHGWLDARGPVEDVVRQALERLEGRPLLVPLGHRSYRVRFALGGALDLPRALPLEVPWRPGYEGRAVLLVTDERTSELAAPLRERLAATAAGLHEVVLPPPPRTKTLASVQRIWETALAAGVDRDALVVAFGGGAVGDVAGFAAATLLRGVDLVQVPTTLLAMADSAVGGKTAIDLPAGKNLVGAFHQPVGVLVDATLLSTLPPAERIAGLAEVVKAAWLRGEPAVARLEHDAEALRAGKPEAVERAVHLALEVKAELVSGDERDAGRRHLLNLGHTFGHALEAAAGYDGLRHGEAVALGLVAAMRVGRSLGEASGEDARRLAALLDRLGLPTDPWSRFDAEAARYLRLDKKRRAGTIRFVVPGAPGRVSVRSVRLEEALALADLLPQ